MAFDEAGNSGGNLLDPDQPVFVLASVHLDTERAAALIGRDGQELKFANLKRSDRGRRRIIELLDSSALDEERLVVATFHKPFMAITKLVDLLVEPLHHARGIDLYERGANIGLANLFHFTMPVFLGSERFGAIRAAFVDMVRFPSSETIDHFYGLLRDAHDTLDGESFKLELAMLLATRPVAEAHAIEWDGSDLDPAIPAFMVHGSMWTARLGRQFSIVHDVSKPLAQEQIVLEAMMSATEEAQTIGYDRRTMAFPIRASGIEFKDSAAYPALQVADIVAGSVAYCLRAAVRKEADAFANALLKTRVLSGHHHPVWPEWKVTPAELGTEAVGGVEPNDYVGDYVANRLGGIPPKGRRRKGPK